MVRISNFVVGFLNCCSLLLGLVAIAISLYFYVHGGSNCQKALQKPLLVTGVFLLVVSLLGLIGSCCRLNSLLIPYLIVMFLLMIGLLGFTVFAFMVTHAGFGKTLSSKGIGNHKSYDFSNWMQKHFVNDKNWIEIRSCLRESKVCSSLGNGADQKASDFYKKNLSPIESGCCKPPSECGFEHQNGTFWTAPKSGPAIDDGDCKTWSNDQLKLCYDCNACKGGVLVNIKKDWRYLAIFNLSALVLVIFTYLVGCCAKKNNRKDNKFRRHHP